MMNRPRQGWAIRAARPLVGLALGVLLLPGCDSKPRAPALEDDAVYHNADAGFRFLVPAGWKQRAKSEVPRGKLDKPIMLVQYMRRTDEGPAMLEVSLYDLPAESDLTPHLTGASHGSEKWQPVGSGEGINVNGAAATRLAFTGKQGQTPATKEVVVIRRGQRTYTFSGVFKSADKSAREQVRGAIASMMWKD